MLSNCEHLQINEAFLQILENFPIVETDVRDNFSRDQKYLSDSCMAVTSVQCPPSLANETPGKLSHARWLTSANRALLMKHLESCHMPDGLQVPTEPC
ncbi:hypothetical protein AVEN_16566-1 [Araneus ventricosus]|uniref:Uncharacterized protein n=2 Tax=Araneus ventricosus TaxID=182803 RepID=A0A4Y2JWA6_ARAVE|nr:hypothetical protein AVEN_16566-1 [Araneus ventricosus]